MASWPHRRKTFSDPADLVQASAAPLPGGTEDLGAAVPDGEALAVLERVILAPVTGRFRAAGSAVHEGGGIEKGQVVGVVEGPGCCTLVISPFRGLFLGLLAYDGERVRGGEPVAWLRVGVDHL